MAGSPLREVSNAGSRISSPLREPIRSPNRSPTESGSFFNFFYSSAAPEEKRSAPEDQEGPQSDAPAMVVNSLRFDQEEVEQQHTVKSGVAKALMVICFKGFVSQAANKRCVIGQAWQQWRIVQALAVCNEKKMPHSAHEDAGLSPSARFPTRSFCTRSPSTPFANNTTQV
jgi:hypothetical protein